MVISAGRVSPRSSFRARSRDRSTKDSTDPDDTVTRRGVFLVAFATFFIFLPPKLLDLVMELPRQGLVPGELEWFDPSHGVLVMVIVAVVVPEHTPIVYSTDGWVDVRKTVL
jgi:hypothetical protein